MIVRRTALERIAQGWKDDPDTLPWLEDRITSDQHAARSVSLARQLMSRTSTLQAAATILRQMLASKFNIDGGQGSEVINQLSLCLIAKGNFAEAKSLIAPELSHGTSERDFYTFNYAMAEWGDTGRLPKDLFARFLKIHRPAEGLTEGPNYYQCCALAAWAVGEINTAVKYLSNAEAALEETEPGFSAWRYLEVNAHEFQEDLIALRCLVQTGQGTPAVFTRTREDE